MKTAADDRIVESHDSFQMIGGVDSKVPSETASVFQKTKPLSPTQQAKNLSLILLCVWILTWLAWRKRVAHFKKI